MTPPAAERPAPWQIAVIALYALGLALLVPRHEPWFDEAQAWLLARDARFVEMYVRWLRYEGNPGLWHALLAPLARAGAPFASLKLLAAAFGVLGAGLFVLRAPFPAWVRALFPFTYFPFYQYAVIARPYAMAGPIFFSLAALWPERFARPFAFAALLGALALVSVHGWLIVAGLAALHLADLWRQRGTLAGDLLRRNALGMVGVLAVGAFVAAVLWPPAEHSLVVPGFQLHPDRGFHVAWSFWNASLTEIAPLSLAVIAASLAWLHGRGALALFAVPAAPVIAFAATKAYSEWHEGMLFLLWIFALWVAWARAPARPGRLSRAALAALAAVLLVQLTWSVRTARYDWGHAYSAAPAVAAHLLETTPDSARVFATGFGSFAVQPYFASNRFDNYRARTGPAFFDSRPDSPLVTDYAAIRRARPDVVIVGVKGREDPEDDLFLEHPERFFPGYTPRVFRGALYWKDRFLEWDAYVVYRRGR